MGNNNKSSLSGEKKIGEKYWSGKRKSGKNLVTCKKFNYFSPTFFSPIRYIILAKNTVISPNFKVWKFCGNAQYPHKFGRFARNYAETMRFHKISTPGN